MFWAKGAVAVPLSQNAPFPRKPSANYTRSAANDTCSILCGRCAHIPILTITHPLHCCFRYKIRQTQTSYTGIDLMVHSCDNHRYLVFNLLGCWSRALRQDGGLKEAVSVPIRRSMPSPSSQFHTTARENIPQNY